MQVMPSTYQSVYIKILMLVYIYIYIYTRTYQCVYIYIKYIVYIHCNCLKRKSSNMSSLSIKSPKKQVRPKQRLTVHRRKGSIQLTLACLIGTTVVSLMVRHHLFWKISVFHGFPSKGKLQNLQTPPRNLMKPPKLYPNLVSLRYSSSPVEAPIKWNAPGILIPAKVILPKDL